MQRAKSIVCETKFLISWKTVRSDNDRRSPLLTLTTTELEYRRKSLVIPFVGVFDRSVPLSSTEKAFEK